MWRLRSDMETVLDIETELDMETVSDVEAGPDLEPRSEMETGSHECSSGLYTIVRFILSSHPGVVLLGDVAPVHF